MGFVSSRRRRAGLWADSRQWEGALPSMGEVRDNLVMFWGERFFFTLVLNRFIKWNDHFLQVSLCFSNFLLEVLKFWVSSWNKVSYPAHFPPGPDMYPFLALEIYNYHECIWEILFWFSIVTPETCMRNVIWVRHWHRTIFFSPRFQNDSATPYCKV